MFPDAKSIIDNIIAYYDNTDNTQYQNSVKRRGRILSYLQHTAEDLWYYRPWPFALASASLVCSAGQAALPVDFGRVGPEGIVTGPDGRAWVEISYQDLVVAWTRGLEAHRRWYAITNKFWVIDSTSTSTFTMLYQTAAPLLVDDSSAIPFPSCFEHALLHGAVRILKKEEGDPRQHWDEEYNDALAAALRMSTPLRSRLRQMPNSVGGKW